jgi:hypothetical protein
VIFFVRRANLYSRLLRTSIILLIVEAKNEPRGAGALYTYATPRPEKHQSLGPRGLRLTVAEMGYALRSRD